MFEGEKVLALVPARGGSKGLPGKNVRDLGGKPLIAWSIEAGRESTCVDEVIVSTDDAEISEAARLWGAEVPFLRPAELATDEAKSIDVILHALDWYAGQGARFGYLLLLQPTSPLRTAVDIDDAFALLADRQGKGVVSVCETEHHPWWSNTLPEDGSMATFLRPEALAGRQQLPPHYRLNGALYLAETGYLRRQRSFLGPQTFAHRMPAERSVDIDTLLDFRLAGLLLSDRQTEVPPSSP